MFCDSLSAITRAAMSGAPPGGIGTMMVIGRAPGNWAKADALTARRTKSRKRIFMSAPECLGRRDWTRTNDPHHVKVVL